MRGTRPSRQSPPCKQPKRGQRRRAGCSLIAKALEAHEATCRAATALRARNGGALAFQHQHEHRRVAAHAVRRAAKQLLHVRNRDTGRSLYNDRACAIAAGAPDRHLDRIGRNNGWCAAGGGGRRLHSTIAISSAARAAERCAVSTQCGKGMLDLDGDGRFIKEVNWAYAAAVKRRRRRHSCSKQHDTIENERDTQIRRLRR
jgi:hypothetical protein